MKGSLLHEIRNRATSNMIMRQENPDYCLAIVPVKEVCVQDALNHPLKFPMRWLSHWSFFLTRREEYQIWLSIHMNLMMHRIRI